MGLLKILNLWREVPADHHAAERLAQNKSFQKFIVNIVEFPRKVANYLVPDEEIAEIKRKEAEKNASKNPKLLEDMSNPRYVRSRK